MTGLISITALILMVAGWMYWRKLAPKVTTFMFLIAGFGLSGLAGALAYRLVTALLGAASNTGTRLLGVAASTILAGVALVATLEVFVKGLHKKKAKPARWHPWLALVLPTIIAVSGLPLLVQGMQVVNQVTTELGRAFTAGIGG